MSSNKSIIVKKIKKIEAGHHGGAWKVAYADFVTAMMAFFLLLWLLSMVSDEKRARLSNYFKHFSMFESGGESWMEKSSEMFNETGLAKQKVFSDSIKNDVPNVEGIEEILNQGIAEHVGDVKDQVLVEILDDGVRIQITDKDGSLMFEKGKKELTPKAIKILEVITEQIRSLPNKVIIEGHTDALQYSGSDYSNWELSTERASSARIALEGFGIDPKRVVRVAGYADTAPLVKEDPLDPSNRRISITIQHVKKTLNPTGKIASDDQDLKKKALDNNVKAKSAQDSGPSLSENFKYRGKALWKTEKYYQQPATQSADVNIPEDEINTDSENQLAPVMSRDYFPLLEDNIDLDNLIIEGYRKDDRAEQAEEIMKKSPITNVSQETVEDTGVSLSEIYDYKKELSKDKSRDIAGPDVVSTGTGKDWSPVLSNEAFSPFQGEKPDSDNPLAREEGKKDRTIKKSDQPAESSITDDQDKSPGKPATSLSDSLDYKQESTNQNNGSKGGGAALGNEWNPVISNDDFHPVQGGNP